MGDEVGAFEEQKYIAEAVTLQGTVQSDPVSILKRHTHKRTHTHASNALILNAGSLTRSNSDSSLH